MMSPTKFNPMDYPTPFDARMHEPIGLGEIIKSERAPTPEERVAHELFVKESQQLMAELEKEHGDKAPAEG